MLEVQEVRPDSADEGCSLFQGGWHHMALDMEHSEARFGSRNVVFNSDATSAVYGT